MKLKEYADLVQLLAKHHPNLDVCYSADDEGNRFHPVQYAPITGSLIGTQFTPLTDITLPSGMKLNAVCIN